MDAFARFTTNELEFTFFDLPTHLLYLTEGWQRLTPDRIKRAFVSGKLQGSGRLGDKPTNYFDNGGVAVAFRTHENRLGAWRVGGKLGDPLNPRGVKVRYKLVHDSESQKPKPVTITGEVADQNGKPLANVRWRISAVENWHDGQWELIHNSSMPQWAFTDAAGRFTLTFNGPQRFDLQFAGLDKLAPAFAYEVSSETRDLKMVMKPGIPLRGTVIASNSKRIPGNVLVELQLPGRDVWYQQDTATDADGHFIFYVCLPPTEPNKAIPAKWQITCAGTVLPFDAIGTSIGMNLLVDARAEIIVKTNALPTPATQPPADREMARLKLEQAEREVKAAELKFSVGTITEYALQKVKLSRDVAAAEVKGDAVEVARLKLAVADLDLDVVGKKVALGLAPQTEYDQAKLARDTAAVRYQQAQTADDASHR